MNLYETVKAAVPLRAAAERYGLQQNWSGMTRCLFHEDHTPSMKLNDDYFYCFGCGTHGDVIDLTAALFGLPVFDAARKLAWDFHVPLDKPVAPPPQSELSPEVRADLAKRKDQQELLWTSLKVLCEYQRLLRRWRTEYAPKSPDEPLDDRFVEACQMYDRIDDLTEGMTVGTEDQRARALKLVTADNKISLLAERLERIRKEEALGEEKDDDRVFFPRWFDGKTINEARFCEEFLERHRIVFTSGAFFTPDGRVTDDLQLRTEIFDSLKHWAVGGVPNKVKNIVEVLKMAASVPDLPPQPDRIHLFNGTLFLDGRFLEGRPEIVRSRLPISYEPDAPEPKLWLRFLEELLYPEDIPTLQEFIGYCLIPSNKGQRMMVIKGSGGEGKSQIGVVLSRVFGTNMKDGSIGKISENRFARADLEHVLLCVDDDMRMEALRQTNYVKSIVTAQGKMDLERKGQQSYQGWMFARLLAFSNGDLQALYDRSNGFYRRQLVLTTRERPKDRIDDPDLAEKMKAEAEGIFLWAFAGLQRLAANNFRFTESERARESRETAKRENNNIEAFLQSEGYIFRKADCSISSKELYEIYRMWCEENSFPALKPRSFGDCMVALAGKYQLEYHNNVRNKAGRRVWGYEGLAALVIPSIGGVYGNSSRTYVQDELPD